MSARYPYLLIDRDGTLITEPPDDYQVDTLEKLEFEPQVIPALLELQKTGFRLIMISNQDGMGTDSFPQECFDRPHEKMMALFISQGIQFEKVFICPHFEEENCSCRKPKLGLLKEFLQAGKLDFERSFVIGDRPTDLELASNLGIKGFQYSRHSMPWSKLVRQLVGSERCAKATRQTKETNIAIEVNLDAQGRNQIETGIGFFDHMLEQIAVHSGSEFKIVTQGDIWIDDHHSIEDTAIVLGEAIKKVLGNKQGIARFGFVLPMDECRAEVLLDLSGRSFFKFSGQFSRESVGQLATEMVPHFFKSLADAMQCTLHLKVEGDNDHHKVESLFKAFGQTLKQAKTQLGSDIVSSKGAL